MGIDCRKCTLEKRGWLRKDYGWEWLGEVDLREERMAKEGMDGNRLQKADLREERLAKD